MKTCIKRLLPVLLLLALPAMTRAQFTYITNNGAITITGYSGPGGAVTVPSTIDGLPVTSIGEAAFTYCTSLTGITLPNRLTDIGDWAFGCCRKLTSLTLPDSVTYIGYDAFISCSSLTNVTIGHGLSSIPEGAFSSCASLTSVTIPSNITSIGDGAFYTCSSLLAIYFLGNAPSVGVFYYGTFGADSVILYHLAGTAGWNPFDSTSAYSRHPMALWNPECQYNYTTNNGTITITGYTGPGGAVVVPNSIHGWAVTGIGEDAFRITLTRLTSITLPSSVTTIGSWAFSDTGLTNMFISASVTSIGHGAFFTCSNLMAITVDAANASYSSVDGILFNKNQTTVVQCPGGRVESVTLPGSVTDLGNMAFYGCSSLLGVTIPNGVTGIGSALFCGCSSLSSVTVPDNVTSIANAAFLGCSSLTNATLGKGVTGIGSYAFCGCNMASITLPSSIGSIGDWAFADAGLREIYFKGSAPSVGDSILRNNYLAIVYYLPGTSGWDITFAGCPTAQWWLPRPLILDYLPSFGVQTNGFGFTISWATNRPVVVEACTDLVRPIWSAVSTNTLVSGFSYFSDRQSTNYSCRLYRLRSP
jgi:hypothetical protein